MVYNLVCNHVCYIKITGNRFCFFYKTFRLNEKWLWGHAIKFSRWQHPAMGREARSTVLTPVDFIFLQTKRVSAPGLIQLCLLVEYFVLLF